mgnify:CR=1 FL=1
MTDAEVQTVLEEIEAVQQIVRENWRWFDAWADAITITPEKP